LFEAGAAVAAFKFEDGHSGNLQLNIANSVPIFNRSARLRARGAPSFLKGAFLLGFLRPGGKKWLDSGGVLAYIVN
jgi:hypothetical protein